MSAIPRPLVLAMLLVAGCPRSGPPEPAEEPLVLDEQDTDAEAGGAPVEPGPWQGSGGLRLTVPDGWSGRTGPEGSSLLLTVIHDETGVQLEVWAFELSGPVEPRPRPACDWMFTDRASHRLVPALTPAITATCVSDELDSPVVQGWYGRVRDREVHVEVVYPPGRVVEGRMVVEPLLAGITSR